MLYPTIISEDTDEITVGQNNDQKQQVFGFLLGIAQKTQNFRLLKRAPFARKFLKPSFIKRCQKFIILMFFANFSAKNEIRRLVSFVPEYNIWFLNG